MTVTEAQPIACTLAPGEFNDRLAWINALTRDALRSHERRDLVLELNYAPEARNRVREMVRNEQACCPFLNFDLREERGEIRLIITAPEAAREAARYAVRAVRSDTTRAIRLRVSAPSSDAMPGASGQRGTRAAGLTAVTLATGALACGACCVLPFALPAAMLAGAGGLLAWFAGARGSVTGLAILAVIGAWGWIAWQTARARRRAAASTLYVMAAATALTAIAMLWPLIEPHLVRAMM